MHPFRMESVHRIERNQVKINVKIGPVADLLGYSVVKINVKICCLWRGSTACSTAIQADCTMVVDVPTAKKVFYFDVQYTVLYILFLFLFYQFSTLPLKSYFISVQEKNTWNVLVLSDCWMLSFILTIKTNHNQPSGFFGGQGEY